MHADEVVPTDPVPSRPATEPGRYGVGYTEASNSMSSHRASLRPSFTSVLYLLTIFKEKSKNKILKNSLKYY